MYLFSLRSDIPAHLQAGRIPFMQLLVSDEMKWIDERAEKIGMLD